MFTTADRLRHPTARPSPLRARMAALSRGIAARLRSWRARDRARRELREVDGAILRDIGLSRSQADFDADKPFWRA